jgi:hypothetical protein
MTSFLDKLDIEDSWKLAIEKTIFIVKCAIGAQILAFLLVIMVGVGFWVLPYFEINILLEIFEIMDIPPFQLYYDVSIFVLTFAFVLGFAVSSFKVIIDIINRRQLSES